MWNVLKMDLYRMVKSRYTWVILILLCVSLVMGMKTQTSMINMAYRERLVGSDKYGIADSITYETKFSYEVFNAIEEMTMSDVAAAPMWGRILSFFIAIFYVLFIHKETSHGYIKNIEGQVQGRWKLIISKFFCMFVYTLVSMTAAFTTCMISARLFLGYMPGGAIAAVFPISGVHLLLQMGCASVLLFLVTFTRNAVISMPVGLFLGSRMLHTMLGFQPGPDHPVVRYSLFGSIERIANGADTPSMLIACAIALMYIIIGVITAIIIIEKRDITT